MKITKSKLKQIIREEYEAVVKEAEDISLRRALGREGGLGRLPYIGPRPGDDVGPARPHREPSDEEIEQIKGGNLNPVNFYKYYRWIKDNVYPDDPAKAIRNTKRR